MPSFRENARNFIFGQSPTGQTKAQGRSGTVNTRGFIFDEQEFNSKLAWPNNLRIYDEMKRTDATIRWILKLVESPIRAASWNVEPQGDDDQAREVAAFVEHALFEELDGGWDEFLRQVLTYLAFGHSVFERVADLRSVEFEYEIEDQPKPPKPPPLPGAPPEPVEEHKIPTKDVKRDAFVIAKLAPRLQRTIEQWHYVDGDSSKLDYIVQRLTDGMVPPSVEIDADRLVVFTHEKEGDDWRGVSLLRSVYKSYRYKLQLENLEAIGYERSTGLPVAYPPSNADPKELDAVEDMVKRIRQGEVLYAVMPGPKQGSVKDVEGWLLEDLAIHGDADRSPDEAIQRHDSAMARNVLAEFMRLGHSQKSGSRAVGDVQQDPYYQSVEAHLRYIEEVVAQAIVKPLVDWNYEVNVYPKVTASKVQAKNVQTVSMALTEMLKAGGVKSDDRLENWFRDLIDAPEKEPPDPNAVPPPPPGLPPGAPLPGGTPPTPPAAPGGNGNGGLPAARPPAPPETSGNGKPPPGPAPGEAQMHAFDQFVPRRPLHPAEAPVEFGQIQGVLDNAAGDIPSIAEKALQGQVESAASAASRAVSLHRPELLDQVTIDPKPLEDALYDELSRLYLTGRSDVRAELRRQVAQATGETPGPDTAAPAINATMYAEPGEAFVGAALAKKLREAAKTAVKSIIALRSPADVEAILRGTAKNQAEVISDQALRAIRTRGLKLIAERLEGGPLAPGEDPMAAIRAAARNASHGLVNRAYGVGRQDEIAENTELLQFCFYSAVLDDNTCEFCEQMDGEYGDANDLPVPVPNPDCQGGDACRCLWIPVTGGTPGARYQAGRDNILKGLGFEKAQGSMGGLDISGKAFR